MKRPGLYDMGHCVVCGNPHVEWHHVYPSARRKASDREGCVAPLCREHHQGNTGVHRDRGLDAWLKADCQRRWEEREGLSGDVAHDAFRKVFYVSYL